MSSFQFSDKFSVCEQSVLDAKTDTIVNAANSTLLGGGGVDGAIHRAAGPELLDECRRLGGCHTGSAKITKAYGIDGVKHIIHAVGPVYQGASQEAKIRSAELLASCYTKSLDLSLEYGCRSIAFPCISTGVYGFPVKEAAEVSARAIVKWLEEHAGASIEVKVCCFRPEEFQAYLELNL